MTKANHYSAACIFACFVAFNANVSLAESPDPPTTTVGQFVSNLNPMNWRMPQWKMPSVKSVLPNQEEKAGIKNKKDGLVSEVSQTASKSWQRTKEVLNPQRLAPSNLFAKKETAPPTSTTQSPGFFSSLFGPKEPEPDRIASVNEFLAQPKVTR